MVETEGYTGRADPGSHAFPGPRVRNRPMFESPGHAYVYRCHRYPLLNVVTEPVGRPGAVLLRALVPVQGLPLMRRRTPGPARDADLARGPGRLARAMAVGMADNRRDLTRGPLRLARPVPAVRYRVRRSTRIGLRGPALRLPWRFFAAGVPEVSGPRDGGKPGGRPHRLGV